MKQVFLTGATGSVGRAVVPQLLNRGYSITALVRQPVNIEHCQTILGRLEDIHQLSGAIDASDAIVHLACTGSAERAEVLQQDIAGVAGLIARWNRGPFIYASSSAVYELPQGPVTECAPISPVHWLGRGKYVNELQLRLAERQSGRGGAALLRPALVFAADSQRQGNVLADVYALCRQGRHFVFDSENSLSQCGSAYVSGGDFARAIAEALTHDLSGAYNIAAGFCTWRDLTQTINRVAGAKGDFVIRPDTRPQAGEFRLPKSRTFLDTSAFQNATGFQPRETLEEIVEAFARMERAQQHA